MKKISLNEEFHAPDGNVWWFVNEDSKVKMKFVRKSGKVKEFIPPTLDEVKAYFEKEGYKEEAAEKFHKSYSSNNWKDTNQKLVKSWKQKAINVWFTEQNKMPHAKKEAPKTNKTDGFII